MHRFGLSTSGLLLALLTCAAPGGAVRGAPAPAPQSGGALPDLGTTADRLAAARTALARALSDLAATPSRPALQAAHGAMRDILAGLDVYFHGPAPAPGSSGARPGAAALRSEVLRLLGGDHPEVVIAQDVLRFRPAVHRQLAAACQKLGDLAAAAEHLRAAQAELRAEGLPQTAAADDLRALLAVYRAAGDTASARAVEAELSALPPAGSPSAAP